MAWILVAGPESRWSQPVITTKPLAVSNINVCSFILVPNSPVDKAWGQTCVLSPTPTY